MMKALSTIKALKVEIDLFQRSSALKTSSKSQPNTRLNTESGQSSSCFACNQEFLNSVLGFVEQVSLNSELAKKSFDSLVAILYSKSMRMFPKSLQTASKRAICAIVKNDKHQIFSLLKMIEADFKTRPDVIPAHLLY